MAMPEITKAQQARIAIRTIKTTVDALLLRGYYKPSGKSGQTLAEGFKQLAPEIYGTMNDHRVVETKGLAYVIDRLPKGIEDCTRIVITAQEDFDSTSFEKIEPPKRRRASYRVSDHEMCFVITRGLSEIYDIITHITFLNNEAQKINRKMTDPNGKATREWAELAAIMSRSNDLSGRELEQAIWNLSIILGRTYQETKETYTLLENSKNRYGSNRGLFQIVFSLGMRVEIENASRDNELLIYFTPALKDMIGHHVCAKNWANTIKAKISILGMEGRPLHIISANLHSVVNLCYGYAANSNEADGDRPYADIYTFCTHLMEKKTGVSAYAARHGFYEIPDTSGTFIDCQLIDGRALSDVALHPELQVNLDYIKDKKPLIMVMDYAFGTQAYQVMDELLTSFNKNDLEMKLNIRSISIMGKAGTLCGRKGDIMLATAHIIEGTADNYIVRNNLKKKDFDNSHQVFVGPIITVLGTSLQNRDVLIQLRDTTWKAVGLEMEGGHYQRAINAAIIRKHISRDVKVSYAYYASDNPLISGQTLASEGVGDDGIRSTYMITKIILEKIFAAGKGKQSA
jgi:hypothetical protein